MPIVVTLAAAVLMANATVAAIGDDATVRLAADPALSPDGKRIVFAYAGDLWRVATSGGRAERLTSHPAEESEPRFSPDGKRIAFISRRSGSPQVWVQDVTAQGRPAATPRQVTHHTAGYQLHGWYPDGTAVLATASRDHYWYGRENVRVYRVDVDRRRADRLWFDGYGTAPCLSPDGQSLLFQREGVEWWRKGYQGSRAAQIWRFDSDPGESGEAFRKILAEPTGSRSPLWKPDDTGFYFLSQRDGAFNVWEYRWDDDEPRQRTHFTDDSVVMPALSADGRMMVFRHAADLYRLRLDEEGATPEKIEIRIAGDDVGDPIARRTLSSVDDAAFTADGLELALIAGGDLWVMDTELREPVNVTDSAVAESEPRFLDDGQAILFLREQEGSVHLWRAERGDPERYWWQQSAFRLTQLTEGPGTLTNLQVSPTGCRIAYVRKPGTLFVADPDGGNPRRLVAGSNVPSYEFSPDGRWIAYSIKDDDFNGDVWITPVDGSADPVNVSRHPKNDYSPTWSPDGKLLAFAGVRDQDNTDLHYVYLRREDADTSGRDRTLEKAVKKLDDARKKKSAAAKKSDSPADDPDDPDDSGEGPEDPAEDTECPTPEPIGIDFEEIHERVQTIRIANASVSHLFWFGEGQNLGFRTSIDGRDGTYTVEFPDRKSPKLLTTDTGSFAGRLKNAKQVAWVSSGTPAVLTLEGKVTKYGFSAKQEYDRGEYFRAGFDVAWRLMRDNWYDDRFNNRNWDEIRRKYLDLAGRATDPAAFGTAVQLMLGELNGSHLGFYPSDTGGFSPEGWSPQTAHLGVRFDGGHHGPGLRIRDVLTDGPADRVSSKLVAGETVLAIDGVTVDPDYDLTQVLNGSLDRDIRLLVRGDDEEATERTVVIRPISQSAAQRLLYPMWEAANRERVDELSEGELGYLHIQGMNMSSLHEFERQLFNVGYGRDGLIIDVRGNGGGSTADLLLTALTQPRHAITVPRGGGPGYPQDRTVFATWHKPIIVLCNQNSFSNAEIFSHAIRVLRRGRLVGVRTAGGVISTGAAPVMDLGRLRQPFRGWFTIADGQDMELNGAVPHVEIWPEPGEMPRGDDRVIRRAVKMLRRDVEKYRQAPLPEPVKASERESVVPAAP